jgi:DNA polymerase I-like protein with 3'-5' exonuclease and polymerase domains
VLQVHDELVYEVREDMAKEAAGVVKRLMEAAVKLKVREISPGRALVHTGA